MKKLIALLPLFFILCSCDDDKSENTAEISECLSNYSSFVRSITEDEIKSHLVGGEFDGYFAEGNVSGNTLTIDLGANLNCADAKYYVTTNFDSNDETVLWVNLTVEKNVALADCMCPKIITFSVHNDADILNKITKLNITEETYSNVYTINIEPWD